MTWTDFHLNEFPYDNKVIINIFSLPFSISFPSSSKTHQHSPPWFTLNLKPNILTPHATSQHHGPPSKLTSHQNNHLNHHQPTKTSINHQKNFITIKTYATIKDHDRDPSQPPSFHLTPTIDHHPPKTSQSHDHQLPEPLFKKMTIQTSKVSSHRYDYLNLESSWTPIWSHALYPNSNQRNYLNQEKLWGWLGERYSEVGHIV